MHNWCVGLESNKFDLGQVMLLEIKVIELDYILAFVICYVSVILSVNQMSLLGILIK
jgi:hypothetical protein